MGLRGEPSAPSALKEVLDDPSLPDDPWLFAMAHWVAGGFAMMAGDMERTEFHNGQVVARGRELGNWLFVGIGLERLAFVHLRGGATEAASSALRESVDCLRRVHYREGLAYDLQGLAHLLAANGDAPAAAEALAAAGAARSVISHAGPIGVWSLYEPDFDALREQLKAVLGDRFSDAWVGGRGRDVYTAADAALSAIKQAK
jgi:hypothetical protein